MKLGYADLLKGYTNVRSNATCSTVTLFSNFTFPSVVKAVQSDKNITILSKLLYVNIFKRLQRETRLRADKSYDLFNKEGAHLCVYYVRSYQFSLPPPCFERKSLQRHSFPFEKLDKSNEIFSNHKNI